MRDWSPPSGIRQRLEVRRGAQGFTDAGDVRKHVKGTERIRAADPVDSVERRHHVVAAPLELRHHRTHHLKGLGVLERLAGRLLNEGRNAAHRVDVDLLEPGGLLRGGEHAPPEPPAGHRVALRVSARDDRVPLHSRKGSHRRMFEAIEGDVLVDLIRIDADVRAGALAHQCGNLLEQALRKYPAVGFEGEHSIRTFVFSVSNRSRSSTVKEKPRSSRSTSGFGTPPR